MVHGENIGDGEVGIDAGDGLLDRKGEAGWGLRGANGKRAGAFRAGVEGIIDRWDRDCPRDSSSVSATTPTISRPVFPPGTSAMSTFTCLPSGSSSLKNCRTNVLIDDDRCGAVEPFVGLKDAPLQEGDLRGC